MPEGAEQLWAGLAASGGLPPGDHGRAWFLAQAEARGLRAEVDGAGNAVAWWGASAGEAVAAGGDLPSGAGADGAGVAAALAAVDVLRARGFEPRRSIALAAFAPARSPEDPPSPGARAAVAGLADPAPAWLARIGGFLGVDVDRGAELAARGQPVGLAAGLWAASRYRFSFAGRADHAGAVSMSERRDPMLGYAMTALAANKQARLAGCRATFGRVEAEPNAPDAVCARVTAWLDARAPSLEALERLVAAIQTQAEQRAGRDQTLLEAVCEYQDPAVGFDPGLRHRLAIGVSGGDLGPLAADHAAGVVARAGIPAALLLARRARDDEPRWPAMAADWQAAAVALADGLAEIAG